jgi:hypothetical protein
MAASNRTADLTVCKQKIICFLVVMLTVESQAQDEGASFDIGGYLKYLFSYSDNQTIGQTADHLLHGRVNTKW